MAIDYTGDYGIFTKIGLIGGFLSEINTFQNALANVKSPPFVDKFTDERKTSLVLDYIPSIESQIQACSDMVPNLLVNIAANVVIDGVRKHDPLIPENISDCMSELIINMNADSQTVKGFTTVASVADVSAKSTVVVGLRNGDGNHNQHIFSEKVRLEVSSDSYSGGTVAGNEIFTIIAKDQASSVYNYDYPSGSGATGTTARVDVTASQSSGNSIENGMFTTATSDKGPEGWSVVSNFGTMGTHVVSTTSGLKIVGNSTEDVRITQEITSSISARNSYAFHFRAWAPVGLTKANAFLYLDLVDSGGNLLVSDSNQACSFSVALNSLTSTETVYTGNFVTGTKMPSQVFLRIGCTTASLSEVYMDRLALAEQTQLYSGGPYVTVFGVASTPVVTGERINITFTKSGETNSTFQTLFNRLFNMAEGGFTLPFSSSPTIADSKIA
jgi:hypothetical protein